MCTLGHSPSNSTLFFGEELQVVGRGGGVPGGPKDSYIQYALYILPNSYMARPSGCLISWGSPSGKTIRTPFHKMTFGCLSTLWSNFLTMTTSTWASAQFVLGCCIHMYVASWAHCKCTVWRQPLLYWILYLKSLIGDLRSCHEAETEPNIAKGSLVVCPSHRHTLVTFYCNNTE